MLTEHRHAIVGFLAALLIVALPGMAAGQGNFPDGPVRIIVPLPAGASADTLPRVVANRLSQEWHQPVIVENRPGAAQNLGAEIVFKAKPDGYTLLATPQGPLTISQSFFKDLHFMPSALVPIAVFARQPLVLVASPNVPAASFKDLIAYAKKYPGKLNFASPGIGSSPHLTGEMLQAEAHIKFTHIPYKGMAPAIIDLLAGRVDLMIDNLPNVIPNIRSGRVKPIAVLEAARIKELPDVPAVAETLPGFHVSSWFAFVAPPETPAPLVEQLSRSIKAALQTPAVMKRFAELSSEPVFMSPRRKCELYKVGG